MLFSVQLFTQKPRRKTTNQLLFSLVHCHFLTCWLEGMFYKTIIWFFELIRFITRLTLIYTLKMTFQWENQVKVLVLIIDEELIRRETVNFLGLFGFSSSQGHLIQHLPWLLTAGSSSRSLFTILSSWRNAELVYRSS